MNALPAWAVDMTDLHVHAAPSLLPRHGDDTQTVAAERNVGFRTVVLKSSPKRSGMASRSSKKAR